MTNINPLQLAFYKGMGGKNGAVQFSVQLPHYYVKSVPSLRNFEGRYIKREWLEENPNLQTSDLTSREGAIFLTITSAVGKNDYDWTQKIIMALSVTDMAKILLVLEGRATEAKLLHDPGAKKETAGKTHKRCEVRSPDGLKRGVIITVEQSDKGGEKKRHMVPLSGDEALQLQCCFRAMIPRALAWA